MQTVTERDRARQIVDINRDDRNKACQYVSERDLFNHAIQYILVDRSKAW